MATFDDWVPATKFAKAHGARLAYQVFGEGSHTILAIPPLAQNIEIAWEQPDIRAMLERFGSFSRYVHFDKRGTGASDRRSRVPGLDERVEDVRAVMDAAGVDHAHLFVQSDGGPMAIMFAATYPERVDSLILFGSFAAHPTPYSEEERIRRRERAAAEWGTEDSRIVDFFAPSRSTDDSFRAWHQRYERQSSNTDAMRELLDLTVEIDVRDVLPNVDTPTLVLHRTGDLVIPIERGRELAENIPGARLVEYDSPDHFAYIGDLDPWMTEVERFVTGSAQARPVRSTKPTSVVIRTLGGFAVEIDGDVVETAAWGSRHARQVCKRLVIARERTVTRDELIDMLWPDEADRRKLSARLSVQLSAVRRILGGGVIADRETVRLDLDNVATDLESFYAASTDEAIVGAYPGELLPEDRYEDWSIPARDEARSRFAAAAHRLARRAIEDERPDEAAELARRLIGADRYDDAAYQLLIASLLASDQIGAAKTAHEAWTTVMAELDIDVAPFDAAAAS